MIKVSGMKLSLIIFLSSIVLSAGIVRWGLASQFSSYDEGISVRGTDTTIPKEDSVTPAPTPTPTATPAPAALPATAQLDVPFTSQAPFGKWDALHQDACEEASFLMVKYFLEGKKMTDKQAVDNEIIAMVKYEEEKGYGLSITLTELNTIVKGKYGLNGTVTKNITIEDIKREVAAGNPVIIGAAGRLLNNPNFTGGGPRYHMLVVTGYDENGFITNDPGTRLGEDYRYSFDTINSALHDWNPIDILNGERNMLVYK